MSYFLSQIPKKSSPSYFTLSKTSTHIGLLVKYTYILQQQFGNCQKMDIIYLYSFKFRKWQPCLMKWRFLSCFLSHLIRYFMKNDKIKWGSFNFLFLLFQYFRIFLSLWNIMRLNAVSGFFFLASFSSLKTNWLFLFREKSNKETNSFLKEGLIYYNFKIFKPKITLNRYISN